jgi:glycosyltransferase involved in cell wall biosynthesis
MEKISTQMQTAISNFKSVSLQSNAFTHEYDLIVFCHLRWEFVFQRPQHIMQRLGKDRKILFVEEPIDFNENNRGSVNEIKVNKNITVIQPRVNWENYVQEVAPIIKKYVRQKQITTPLLWFYSAHVADMMDEISHRGVVYDCMDELAAFKNAPQSLVENEKRLLRMADVVFTGGKSLYESKKRFQSNVYCFPSSVDHRHFEKALKRSTSIPSDLKAIPGPRVGFYGVIDERLDTNLLKEVSKLMPQVSFVVIGPVVKIREADLPQAPNLYYLGSKSYKDLPNYLKGFDVAMMPFALNEATQFISPTKTLEFMAALKPIISTAIYDVVRDYKSEVKIIETARDFKKAVRTYLAESSVARKKRIALQKAVIEQTSWDNTVKSMKKIISTQLSPSFDSDSAVRNVSPLTLGFSA